MGCGKAAMPQMPLQFKTSSGKKNQVTADVAGLCVSKLMPLVL